MLNGKRRVTCAITQHSFRVKRNVTHASVPIEVYAVTKGNILPLVFLVCFLSVDCLAFVSNAKL